MENMLDHQNTNQFYLLSVIVGVDIVEDLRLRGAIRFRNQCVEDHLPGQGMVPDKKNFYKLKKSCLKTCNSSSAGAQRDLFLCSASSRTYPQRT